MSGNDGCMRQFYLVRPFGCLWAGPAENTRKVLPDGAHSKECDTRGEAAAAMSRVPASDAAEQAKSKSVFRGEMKSRAGL